MDCARSGSGTGCTGSGEACADSGDACADSGTACTGAGLSGGVAMVSEISSSRFSVGIILSEADVISVGGGAKPRVAGSPHLVQTQLESSSAWLRAERILLIRPDFSGRTIETPRLQLEQ